MTSDRLEHDIAFYGSEFHLFRAGTEAYLTMLAGTATRALDSAGGIGPYEFSCQNADGNMTPYIFRAKEL